MPTVDKISIALPPEMVAQVRQAAATGEYASSSEVARDALRDWLHKRQLQQNDIAELRQLWQEARAKSRPYVPAEEFMTRLERRYQALARGRRSDGCSLVARLGRTWIYSRSTSRPTPCRAVSFIREISVGG